MKINYIGMQFGRLTVIKKDIEKSTTKGRNYYFCKCTCGNTKSVSVDNLRSGCTTSCGCYFDEIKLKSKNLKDLTGQIFGRLTVLERYYNPEYPKTVYWKCLCSYGNVVNVSRPALHNKSTQSCGCLAKEKNVRMWKNKEFVENITKARYDKWYNTDRIRGENNPAWKGGVSSEKHLIRESSQYKNWRNFVFWFDDYTCQKCDSSKSGTLNAHHMQNFSQYPEKIFDKFNGITFCKDCHEEFHGKYGYTNNNLEQIQEFLGGSNDRY